MKPTLIATIFFVMFFYACNDSVHSSKGPVPTVIKNEIIKPKETTPLPNPLKPVFGYRFIITGNFDGSRKIDTLTEHFFSGITHKETNKFYEGADYDRLVDSVNKQKPYCFLSSSNKNIKPLIVERKSQFGLSYLKNEGDLTGDGIDDISFVVNYADWSSVNFCTLMTYKNGKWKQLYYFEIRDWQLPDLPQGYRQFGIAGLQDMAINGKDDSLNRLVDDTLKSFAGLIKKTANNKIRIIGGNMSADGEWYDTLFVNLKTRRAKTKSGKYVDPNK